MNLTEIIEASGIIGCGGAGFPTHVKLNKSYEYLIVNGAECEPMLRNDRYLMREKALEIVTAMAEIKEALGIDHAVIALKEHYEEEIAALSKAAADSGFPVEIKAMDSFYPAGDEQTIVYEVTGRVVPPAGLPAEVGCVVDNVATVYAIYEALRGRVFTHKYLTVTGEVEHPVILYVPVGISFAECIELAGGPTVPDYTVISGGPMMGRFVADPGEAVVTKTTSGILVLPSGGHHAKTAALSEKNMLNRAKSACIQCSRCSDLCPRHLLGHPIRPHMIMRKMASGGDITDLLDDHDIQQALICCECGICETYACPMGLNPRKINQLIKAECGKRGIRYQRDPSAEYVVSPEREYRKAPTDRVAGKIGTFRYNRFEIKECLSAECDFVRILLKMAVGPASVPCVSAGDRVEEGSLIAMPREGALGARIHSSISGTVSEVNDTYICITK